MRKLNIIVIALIVFLSLAFSQGSIFRWQVDYGETIGGGSHIDSLYADTLDVGVMDTLGAYADTNTANTLQDTIDTAYDLIGNWIAARDTFGGTATTDTVVLDTTAITITSAVVNIYTTDITKAYTISVSTSAGTLFVYRAESDTAKSDIYNYIVKEQ